MTNIVIPKIPPACDSSFNNRPGGRRCQPDAAVSVGGRGGPSGKLAYLSFNVNEYNVQTDKAFQAAIRNYYRFAYRRRLCNLIFQACPPKPAGSAACCRPFHIAPP
ncbi:hypothetical protein [Acerihabitans arboris]|uniref:hypothetical protein n=1 Tax=Acerihabitans arboris TaxID=2691583 RepID=UPI001C49C318|nr:hypothetical protein [Acerihabitans arboris]